MCIRDRSTPCPYGTADDSHPPPAKRVKSQPTEPAPKPAPKEAAAQEQPWRWSMPQDQVKRPPRDSQTGPKPPGVKSVFVGNLPFKMDEPNLGGYFAQFGEICSVTIARDGSRSKGHGWVDFTTEQAAEAAICMNGQDIGGRAVRVDWGKSTGGSNGPPPACWFCLSNPQVEEHLIVSVGNLSYLALAKGGLVHDHLLVVPIQHVPCASPLPNEIESEIEVYKAALHKFWKAEGEREMVAYERHIVMRNAEHFHVQLVPVPKGIAGQVAAAFGDHPSGLRFELAAEGVVRPQGQGFAVEAAGETIIHTKDQQQIPMQLGREVLADLLGFPERANWKSCAQSQAEEKRAADSFKEAFAKYDPFHVED
eukprot:TRINITY_DN3718_c0_g1_i1.p1 TRINITY_DN3718_c0_g1~~TRINITY_DN3718_c0_g1_i1.p1  ORF type:complete len:366 (-),score=84.95 TRINITY_DN3718_c0_g1_i1:453-1550(-)